MTSEHKLIEQFAKKNPKKQDKTDLSKLKLLLKSKGWDLTDIELQEMIYQEIRKQQFQNVKSIILENNPESRNDILNSYLNHYQIDDNEIDFLEEILRDKGLEVRNLAVLKVELEKLKQEVEAEQFESKLMDESE